MRWIAVARRTLPPPRRIGARRPSAALRRFLDWTPGCRRGGIQEARIVLSVESLSQRSVFGTAACVSDEGDTSHHMALRFRVGSLRWSPRGRPSCAASPTVACYRDATVFVQPMPSPRTLPNEGRLRARPNGSSAGRLVSRSVSWRKQRGTFSHSYRPVYQVCTPNVPARPPTISEAVHCIWPFTSTRRSANWWDGSEGYGT